MIKYIGEHLLLGQIGNFIVLLAFCSSILSAYAYYKATVNIGGLSETPWIKVARTSFWVNAISILALFMVLLSGKPWLLLVLMLTAILLLILAYFFPKVKYYCSIMVFNMFKMNKGLFSR